MEDTDAIRVSNYLAKIRSQSAYKTFRVVVNVMQWLLFVIAGVCILASFMAHDSGTFMGLIFAGVLIVVAKVGKQATVMLADIADATIDAASKK